MQVDWSYFRIERWEAEQGLMVLEQELSTEGSVGSNPLPEPEDARNPGAATPTLTPTYAATWTPSPTATDLIGMAPTFSLPFQLVSYRRPAPQAQVTSTATPKPTKTPTPTQTSAATSTGTAVATATASATSSPTAANTATATVSATFSPTATNTASVTPTPLPAGPITISYIYDPLNRLTETNYSTGDYYHYSYDAVGNRLNQDTQVGGLPATTTYLYDDANRVQSVSGVTYTFDANGNLLNDGVNTYTYDSANRLKTVNSGSVTASYAYNGLNDRLQQTVNGTTSTFTMDLNTGLTQALSDGTNHYIYGVDRIAQVNSATEYFLGDALGSVRQLTDQSGEVTYASAYDPYGVVTSTVGDSQSAYGYTNEYTDSYIKLIYLRSRWYDPYLNQFIQPDTIVPDPRIPADWNKYTYVRNNPINYTDPLGLCVNCYVFFFPGLGNNGVQEIGIGEKRLVDEIGLRTGARVTVMYPYGTGLTGNLSAGEKYRLIYDLAKEKSSLPKYKAQEILGWLIVGLQLDSHVELCYDGFDDEQLNITFVGYSGGGQVAYSTAQALSGTLFVDNLVLFGAPYRAHDGLGNIGQLWDFVSVQDDVIFGTAAIIPWARWREDNLYMYAYENATYCALAGDETTPYVHYDNGVNDYFGVDPKAKFNGQSCFGAHPEQSASSEFVAPLNLSRFEANMTMLVGIIEGRVK